MASRCQYCAGLSISRLIDLAKQEFSGRNVPERAFYYHHESLYDLESSANNGCDLCMLILDGFKSMRGRFTEYDRIEEKVDLTNKLKESFFHQAKNLPSKGLKICIKARHLSEKEGIDKVIVFDQIYVHIEKDTLFIDPHHCMEQQRTLRDMFA
ncbi:hypothetical protein F4805DRAFT_453878 [Annulohypoxylon moriforme]|nr:hypothetical protein F4805DRAFT_453878 [Annulohypoxylon moriforme]